MVKFSEQLKNMQDLLQLNQFSEKLGISMRSMTNAMFRKIKETFWFFQFLLKTSLVTPIFFHESSTLVLRMFFGKFKKFLLTQIFGMKFHLFYKFQSTEFFYFFPGRNKCISSRVQIFKVPYRTRLGATCM